MLSPRMVALIFVVLGLCVGCLSTKRARFDVVVKNVGQLELDNVRVQFDGYFDEPGVLPSGADKSFSDYIGTFPTQATISWRLPGPAYMPESSEVVLVPKIRPNLARDRDQEYELLFELNGHHVTAKYIVNDYTDSNKYTRQSEKYKDQLKERQ